MLRRDQAKYSVIDFLICWNMYWNNQNVCRSSNAFVAIKVFCLILSPLWVYKALKCFNHVSEFVQFSWDGGTLLLQSHVVFEEMNPYELQHNCSEQYSKRNFHKLLAKKVTLIILLWIRLTKRSYSIPSKENVKRRDWASHWVIIVWIGSFKGSYRDGSIM